MNTLSTVQYLTTPPILTNTYGESLNHFATLQMKMYSLRHGTLSIPPLWLTVLLTGFAKLSTLGCWWDTTVPNTLLIDSREYSAITNPSASMLERCLTSMPRFGVLANERGLVLATLFPIPSTTTCKRLSGKWSMISAHGIGRKLETSLRPLSSSFLHSLGRSPARPERSGITFATLQINL